MYPLSMRTWKEFACECFFSGRVANVGTSLRGEWCPRTKNPRTIFAHELNLARYRSKVLGTLT